MALMLVGCSAGNSPSTDTVSTTFLEERQVEELPSEAQSPYWVPVPFEIRFLRVATLDDVGIAILEEAAASITSRSEIGRIRVEGHAGPWEESPWELSRRRAQLVTDQLVSFGVPTQQLEVVPLGDMVPSLCRRSGTASCDRIAEHRVGFRMLVDPRGFEPERDQPSDRARGLLRGQVRFEANDDSLDDADRDIVRRVAGRLLSERSPRRIRLLGQASVREEEPDDLSLRRARAVAEHMVSLGVPRGMVEAVAEVPEARLCETQGESCPSSAMRRVRFLLLMVTRDNE